MTHYSTLVQTYYCDHAGCFASFEVEGHARAAGADMRRDGWRKVQGQHLCPAHARKSHDSGSA